MYIRFTKIGAKSALILPYGEFSVEEVGDKVCLLYQGKDRYIEESFSTVLDILRVAHTRLENPDMLFLDPESVQDDVLEGDSDYQIMRKYIVAD